MASQSGLGNPGNFSRKKLKFINEEILMKKTLTYLLVVVALVALAASASAVTCTIDQRPAATLLVPYFQVHLNADGSVDTSATRTDTLITVVNASSQATLAHVVIWNRRSVHLLDFNIALTAFDEVSWSMEDVLTGILPSTPGSTAPFVGQRRLPARDVARAHVARLTVPDFAPRFLRFTSEQRRHGSGQFPGDNAVQQPRLRPGFRGPSRGRSRLRLQ